jgi:hypothetical protein
MVNDEYVHGHNLPINPRSTDPGRPEAFKIKFRKGA